MSSGTGAHDPSVAEDGDTSPTELGRRRKGRDSSRGCRPGVLLDEAAHETPEAKAAATARVVHKAGEVNISAYFPAEVKASLRLVQAKTGKNVKQCLGEALADLYRKHNVPVPAPME